MHKWHVTVQLTYDVIVYTADNDPLDAHEAAFEEEDPDFHPPHIMQCAYLGAKDPEHQPRRRRPSCPPSS